MINEQHPQSNNGLSADYIDALASIDCHARHQGTRYVVIGDVALSLVIDSYRAPIGIDIIADNTIVVNTPIPISVKLWNHPVYGHVADNYSVTLDVGGTNIKALSPAGLFLLGLYRLPVLYRQEYRQEINAVEYVLRAILIDIPALDMQPFWDVLATEYSDVEIDQLIAISTQLKHSLSQFNRFDLLPRQ